MLDLVPLGGPWAGPERKVAAGDLQPGLGGQRGQLGLPRPGPVAVGPAALVDRMTRSTEAGLPIASGRPPGTQSNEDLPSVKGGSYSTVA